VSQWREKLLKQLIPQMLSVNSCRGVFLLRRSVKIDVFKVNVKKM